MHNCSDCLYANKMTNGGVYCDRREFEGVKTIISPDKASLNCCCHSNYIREETRYGRPWKYEHEADDVCQVCNRFIDLNNKDQYTYVNVKNEDGNIITIRKCSICVEKGR